MNQEFQRITQELAKLQQEILRNQLPSLLIGFQEQSDISQLIESFIKNIIIIEKTQFINSITENIVNVKKQNNQLKIQNQNLKNELKKGQFQVLRVQQTVKDITHQKNCLYAQLQDLRAKQISLGKLMNSNSVQLRIKQMMKENEHLKNILLQKNKQIQIKQASIQAFSEKQIFLNNQVQALQNDNILFHQDLTRANDQIKELTHKCNNISTLFQSLKEKFTQNNNSLQQCTQTIKQKDAQLLLQKQHAVKKQQQFKINLQKLQQTLFSNDKQLQRVKDIGQQNQFLRNSLQQMQNKLQQMKLKQGQYLGTIKQNKQQMQILNNRISNIQQCHKQVIQDKNNQTIQMQKQLKNALCQLQQQAKIYKQNYNQVIEQFKLFKTKAQQSEQKQIQQHQTALKQLQQLHNQLINTNNHQHTQNIQQYKSKLQILYKQIQQCRSQLQNQKELSQYYMQYLAENNQLKAQLQRLTTKVYQQTTNKFGCKKLTFQLIQTNQVINRLKKQNLQLKNSVHTILQSNKRWIMKQINKLVCILMEKKSECQTCHHWEKYQNNKKSIGEINGKQIQVKSIKDIKNLSEKFKLIKEQNQKFGNRIQQIIHN